MAAAPRTYFVMFSRSMLARPGVSRRWLIAPLGWPPRSGRFSDGRAAACWLSSEALLSPTPCFPACLGVAYNDALQFLLVIAGNGILGLSLLSRSGGLKTRFGTHVVARGP